MISMSPQQARQFADWSGIADPAPFADWEGVPIVQAGRLIGMGAVDGTEVHIALAPAECGTGRLTRRLCREWLSRLLERRGFLTTRAYEPSDAQTRFLERIGFERTRVDGSTHHYMLSALPFEKKQEH